METDNLLPQCQGLGDREEFAPWMGHSQGLSLDDLDDSDDEIWDFGTGEA